MLSDSMQILEADTGSGPTPMLSETCTTLHYVRSDASPSDEIDMSQAVALLDSGQLNGNSFVWTEGMTEWAKLSDCASLFALSLDSMKLHYETRCDPLPRPANLPRQ